MRAAFGLVGVLVALAILILLWGGKGGYLDSSQSALKTGQQIQAQTNVLAGRDTAGTVRAIDTIEVELDQSSGGGPVRGLKVTKIDTGGAMEQRFGLKVGDVIVEIGPISVRDMVMSVDEGRDYLWDAYQRGTALRVRRGAVTVTMAAKEMAAPVATGTVPGSTGGQDATPVDNGQASEGEKPAAGGETGGEADADAAKKAEEEAAKEKEDRRGPGGILLPGGLPLPGGR